MNINLIKKLLIYIEPYKKYIFLSIISSIIYVALTLLTPVIIGEGIDYIVYKNNVDFENLIKIIGILIAVFLISSIFQLIMTRSTNILCYKTIKQLRMNLFEKLNKVPLKYIDGNSTGSIINTVINDLETVSDGLIQSFSQLFTGVLTIAGTFIFMLSINYKIALVVFFVTPISLFTASVIAKACYSMFTRQSEVRSELTGLIEELISNQKLVKSFNYEETALKKFNEISKRLYNYGQKAQFYSAITNPATRFVNGIVYTLVGVFGGILVVKGAISVGNLSAFLSYANQYTKPFNEISGVITELQAAFSSLHRVFNILEEENEIEDPNNAIELENCNGYVELNNVNFSYSKAAPLIENLNLKVKPGEKIAIVGPTGSGKTTLINLLMRFYNINSGEIKIDNINIEKIKRSSVRSLYGMVLQDTFLYQGTIKDNIAYGKPNASMEEVIEAAKKAHAHDFIVKLPQGYNTVLSEDSSLSEGQKQLLSIARVMLSKPSMLILDEATSNIDTRTEIYIQKAFNELMKNKTTFIVAHRLSTIKEADLIIVMDNGKVVEQGNHKELLEKRGFYAKLYNSQFETT
ncbi:ABC transporter ATP-binding protein [Caproiciproducens sp. MSJ-32]|uniref:ABC transporter ATP-binding protein n=1 Tax=Caproiciproducens sp. MSJ-32 TaxID=2841527 RepID=UPI001C0F8A1D|nr:ABC transporter ATP-binding protein [Caproiciproducens sp. MSJ-32]MBU5454107.1 ABC transporter ATP-binding protein/permease [Caproiciproducens sp. MSJ-32]